MADMFQAFSEMFGISYELHELAAIWLNKKVVTGDGTTTGRLVAGMTIRVEDNQIVDCPEPTHRIEKCEGDLHSTQLYLILTDLKTNEPLRLKVK